MSAAGLARARLEDAQCAGQSWILVDWLRKEKGSAPSAHPVKWGQLLPDESENN